MNAHDIHSLIGPYAVNALDDSERASFEAHVADCAECRAEVLSLQEAASRLAIVVAAPPPASLRSTVLSGIASVRPLPPTTSGSQDRRTRRWAPLAVAATLLAVIGVGAIVANLFDEETAPEVTMSATERVLRASDAERIAVRLSDTSSAMITRSDSMKQAVIETDNMAPAPAGQVYQLWLQVGQEMVSAGMMPAGPRTTMLLDGDASLARAVGITVEPAGGSPQPTSEPIAVVELSEAS